MIAALGYDGLSARELDLTNIPGWLAQPGARIWLDVLRPADDDRRWLEGSFGLSAADLEECGRPHPLPGVASQHDYLFGRMDFLQAPAGEALSQPFCFFLGADYLITLHPEPLPAIATEWSRYQDDGRAWQHGLDHLLYRLLAAGEEAAQALVASRGVPDGAAPAATRALGLAAVVEQQADALAELTQLDHPALDANVRHQFGLSRRRLLALGQELRRARQEQRLESSAALSRALQEVSQLLTQQARSQRRLAALAGLAVALLFFIALLLALQYLALPPGQEPLLLLATLLLVAGTAGVLLYATLRT
jgi:hypothetical protein